MRTRAVTTFLAVLCVAAASAAAQNLVIKGGMLFDSVSDELRRNTGIVIIGGKFAAVDADLADFDTEGFSVIDLARNDTILPGIFDLHAHYNITAGGQRRQDEPHHYSAIYLANGVTSTFPGGEYNPEEMLAMRLRIDRGEQPGPRVYSSGPYYGQHMPRGAGRQEVFDRVDEWAAKGARGFKAKGINKEQLAALIERAHQHGLTVTAHLGSGRRGSVNPKDAVLMGIDRVEHFLGGDLLPAERSAYATLQTLTEEDLDSPAFKEIVDLFIERGTFFDATLTAYGYSAVNDEVYEKWHDESKYFTDYVRERNAERQRRRAERGGGGGGGGQFGAIYRVKHLTLKRFYDAGGLITLGTDHVSSGEYLGGFAAHREMHAFTRAGIAPADALKMATINGARAINVADKLGTIEQGKFADLFIIKGDPLEDIRNTRSVHTVVKSGVVYDTAALLKSVEGKMGPSEPIAATPTTPTSPTR